MFVTDRDCAQSLTINQAHVLQLCHSFLVHQDGLCDHMGKKFNHLVLTLVVVGSSLALWNVERTFHDVYLVCTTLSFLNMYLYVLCCHS